MKYACTDLETSGLDSKVNQTLEIGIVLDDWDNPLPLDQLSSFHCYVLHEKIVGHPFALALNAEILKKIGQFLGERDKSKVFNGWYNNELYLWPHEITPKIKEFLDNNKFDPLSLNGAGKNFDTFDKLFLYELPDFIQCIKFHYRALDPVMRYFDPKINLDKLPSLKQCLTQGGIEKDVEHRGLADAYDVIRLLRKSYNIPI